MLRRRIIFFPLLFCLGMVHGQDPGSTDPKERAKAARELGKQGSTALPQLQTLLGDTDLDVRIEAVKAIVDVGTQHSLDPLILATRDNDPEIQIRATDGLVNFYLPGYVRTGFTASLRRVGSGIKGKFTDTNDEVIDPFITVRPEVIEAIGKLARGGASMEVRANAARAAGILRGKAAIPDLVAALRSKDTQVIYEVLIALQKIRDPEAASEIEFLLRDLDEKVQIAAIETTGLLRNNSALPALRNVLERSRNKKVRRAALTAIAMLPDAENRALFLKYLDDKDDDLRAAAAEGLARIKNPEDLPKLDQTFREEKKMNPRLSAAFALVMLGKTEVAEFSPLQYLVNTLNSSAYRGVARPFLVELTRNEKVRESLYPAVDRGTKDEKILLAEIFARSGDKDTLPVLERLSRDPETEVAQEGLRALRTLRARLQ